MPSYTIYEKPGLPPQEAIDSAVLIKDHYSIFAFMLPAVWMLVQRLWWILLVYIIILIPVAALESMLPVWAGMLITLLMNLWISLEAPNMIGWSLRNKGYVEVASLYAEDMQHCEHRYVAARLANAEDAPLSALKTASGPLNGPKPLPNQSKSGYVALKDKMRDTGTSEPIIGLFPTPNRSRET